MERGESIAVYRYLKSFLLVIVTIALLIACHSQIAPNAILGNSTLPKSPLPVATKVVKHPLGETRIPVKPQRIIVLNDIALLDPVLSLGVKPIGTVSYFPQYDFLFRGVSNAEAVGIEIIGNGNQPNLEKVLKLKPDLILMREYQKSMYSQLSAIAPTVMVDLPGLNYSFKKNLRFIAQVLDESEKAEQVIAQYYERVKKLQNLIGERLKELEVSVIYIFGENLISTYSDKETYNQVFQDIGIRLIPVLANQKQETVVSSIEVLNKYDADILFVMNDTAKLTQAFFQNPLLSQLKSAQKNQIYEVQVNRWWTYGFFGVNKLLDDLFKYLVQP
ncbi:iron-siderophore ABC transporter substrate-binding protein [Nostoc sp. UCD121]|uniref:iron-siderophore ABC transporter substrate-binding protein n=1 Tax=unclassified Nostoc TaxID=2593658 RepID=UPI001627BAD5|nr:MULTISPECIES: iron-siderophore ABC transporter substrate-binding protein [unclassified Nostoc]MBC1222480.1 iron-siderophore ABC transporter substrate-binding protein [Nostoc sp. UCD120]MBC1277035.1 iron-siderophore ABC transporter substrate-binding protein [Nostoc sp. UCD121]MBC1297188.1 iron-siderophore ABC transporter substrate-binding protein [Nostoc sp. UCD122]